MTTNEVKKIVKIVQGMGFRAWVFDPNTMTEAELAEEMRDAQAHYLEYVLGIKPKEKQ